MFQVDFTPVAEADLACLDKPIAQRMLKRIRWLAENFGAITPEALTGPWQGVFKLRVGDIECCIPATERNRGSLCALLGIVVRFTSKALANLWLHVTPLHSAGEACASRWLLAKTV